MSKRDGLETPYRKERTMKRTQCMLAAVVAGTLGMACSGAMGAVYTNAEVTSVGTFSTISISGNENILNDGTAYAHDLTNLGRQGAGITLSILNGTTNVSGGNLAMGYTTGSGPGNLLLIDGAGSSATFTSLSAPGSLIGGTNYSGQSVTIQNGGSATFSHGIIVGRRGTAADNALTVDNGTCTVGAGVNTNLRIGGDNSTITGGNNTVTVKNGGTFIAGSSSFITGLSIGFTGSTSVGNLLTLESGGLFRLDNPTAAVTVAANNYIRFDGGSLAWKGTHSLADSAIQVRDGAGWAAGVLGTNYTATYYADYAGLGDYTVFTNVAVPEPTSLLITGSALGLLAMRRRKH